MSEFDRQQIEAICAEVEAAIESIGERHKFTCRCLPGEINPLTASVRIELTAVRTPGCFPPDEEQRDRFIENANAYGLQPEDWGCEFDLNGGGWTVFGINPAAPRYPLVATKHADGRQYKLKADVVKMALENSRAQTGSQAPDVSER